MGTWDPQLNAPHTSCATSVSTYDDGTNPAHHQQQVIGKVAIP